MLWGLTFTKVDGSQEIVGKLLGVGKTVDHEWQMLLDGYGGDLADHFLLAWRESQVCAKVQSLLEGGEPTKDEEQQVLKQVSESFVLDSQTPLTWKSMDGQDGNDHNNISLIATKEQAITATSLLTPDATAIDA